MTEMEQIRSDLNDLSMRLMRLESWAGQAHIELERHNKINDMAAEIDNELMSLVKERLLMIKDMAEEFIDFKADVKIFMETGKE